jgi:hypothetical protein
MAKKLGLLRLHESGMDVMEAALLDDVVDAW